MTPDIKGGKRGGNPRRLLAASRNLRFGVRRNGTTSGGQRWHHHRAAATLLQPLQHGRVTGAAK